MDRPTQQAYPYQPLNLPYETRVLTVQPAKRWADPIICSLSHITLPTSSGTTTPPSTEPDSLMRDGEQEYQALSYCWSQSVTNISKGKPPPAPETVSTTCTLRTDPDGNEVTEHGTILFKDMLDDPVWHCSYISSGGPLPAGEILCDGVPFAVGGELHRALLRLRPYYPEPESPETAICPGWPDCPGFDPAISTSSSTVKPLRIWIDAICINQSDPLERNQHVRMMAQIYRSAAHVHIWLGEPTGVEDRVAKFLYKADEILAKAIYNVCDSAGTGAGSCNTKVEAHRLATQQAFVAEYNAQRYNSDVEGVDPLDWDALTELLEHRAWFSRTWIVQEAANARSASFRIGNVEIGWGLLADVVSSLRRYRADAMVAHCEAIKAVCMMEHLRGEMVQENLEGSSMSLVRLLEELRGLRSTMASDKIYGILGLARPGEKDALVVDYEKSCEEVFVDFAVGRLLGDAGGSGSVDILSHCVMVSSSGDPVLDLPSWVPDWTRPGFVEPFSIRELDTNACGNLITPELSISDDKTTLTIKGYVVDTIAEIETENRIPLVMKSLADVSDLHPEYPKYEPRLLDEDGKPKTLQALRSERYHELQEKIHRNIVRIAFPESVSTDEKWNALWRTFMCNRTRENEIPEDLGSCRGGDGFDVVLGSYVQRISDEAGIAERLQHKRQCHGFVPGSEEEQEWVEGLWKGAEMVRQANSKWCRHRRFVRSEGGRYGWVLHGTEVGDKVVVLKGGKWPFVLRELKGDDMGGTRYKIVGDCYLHGVMEGEVVDEGSGYDEVELVIV